MLEDACVAMIAKLFIFFMPTCYLCQHEQLETIRTRLRHDVERNVFRCQSCSLIFLDPKLIDADTFYGVEYRNTYTPVIGEVLNSRATYDMYKPFQMARVERLGSLINADARVLDIGCSAGHFLSTIKPLVKECVGIEYNRENAAFVNGELGIKVYTDPIEKTDLTPETFDVITLYQMFEHVADPLPFLQTLARYLKPGGSLCIEVPNVDEALISIYRSQPFADFSFREPHLFYYSPKTLPLMAKNAGLVGTTRTIQRINFLNHIHWIMTGQPQKGPDIHMAPSRLLPDDGGRGIAADLNNWMRKVDNEYGEILTRYDVGESVWFIGKKQP